MPKTIVASEKQKRNRKSQDPRPCCISRWVSSPGDYPGPIADHPDAARWLLSTIYIMRLLRNRDKDDFINLHSDYWVW